MRAGINGLIHRITIRLRTQRYLFLLVRGLQRRRTTLRRISLLIRHQVTLNRTIRLLFNLRILLNSFIRAINTLRRMVKRLRINHTFSHRRTTTTKLLHFGQLLHRNFLELHRALLISRHLRFLSFLIRAYNLFQRRIVLTITRVLRLVITNRFLTARQGRHIRHHRFNVRLVTLLTTRNLTIVFTNLRSIISLLSTHLTTNSLHLHTLKTHLHNSSRTINFDRNFLRVTLLNKTLNRRLLRLLSQQINMTLYRQRRFNTFRPSRFTLVLSIRLKHNHRLLLRVTRFLLMIFLIIRLNRHTLGR